MSSIVGQEVYFFFPFLGDNPSDFVIGKKYVVDGVYIGSFTTQLAFVGIDGLFNSYMFTYNDEESPDVVFSHLIKAFSDLKKSSQVTLWVNYTDKDVNERLNQATEYFFGRPEFINKINSSNTGSLV